MPGLNYYQDFMIAIKEGMRVALSTEVQNYVEDTADALAFITGQMNMFAVLITWDINTREIFDKVTAKGGDVEQICVVDAVSLTEGKGTPPVAKIITINSPLSFDEIFIYTHMFLERYDFENICVFFLALDKLTTYQKNINEIAVFLTVFSNLSKKRRLAEIYMMHNAFDMGITQVISTESQSTIKIMRKLVFSRKLLIIDDEISDLGVLKMLEKSDFELTTVNSGEKGIEEMEKRMFDGIIINIDMHSLNDKELAKIMELKQGKPTKIIVASLSGQKDVGGADGFLRRPFSTDTIANDVSLFFKKG